MNAPTTDRITRPWIGTVDGIPRIENRRLEDHDTVVTSSSGTPWSYRPVGPFQFQMFHQNGAPEHTCWVVDATLEAAVNTFARWALPPRFGYAAEIVDATFRQVLCGLWSDEAWEIGGAWWGCKAAFDVMRAQQCCDDVTMAIWEGAAMTTAPGSGFEL